MGSFMPSSPASNPLQPEQIPPTSLMQLALAVKSMKMQETQQQKQEASGRLDMLLKNPQLLMMMDPKMIERDFGSLGYKLGSPEQMDAAQKTAEGGGDAPGWSLAGTPPPAPPQATPVPTSSIAKLGAATQGSSAGAQSATPPSPEAARRAPGGGVPSGGIVTPGTGQLDQLKGQAEANFNQRYGAVAPLYQGAQMQIRADQIKQQHQMEIDEVASRAAEGDPRAMGRMMMLAGHPVTDADLRAMIFSSSNAVDDTTRAHALDFAFGYETPAQKEGRYTDTLKSIFATPDFMSSLPNPGDAPRVAQSIVDGHGMPSDIAMQMPLSKIVESNKYAMDLMSIGGLAPRDAMKAADARSVGIPYTLSLPETAQGLTIPQQQVEAQKTAATGTLMRGEAEMMMAPGKLAEAYANAKRLEAELAKDPAFQTQLENMINMSKAGMKVDPAEERAMQEEVAKRAGFTKEEVNDVWQILLPWRMIWPQYQYRGTASSALEQEKATGEQGHDPMGVISGKPSELVSDAERKAIQRMTRR